MSTGWLDQPVTLRFALVSLLVLVVVCVVMDALGWLSGWTFFLTFWGTLLIRLAWKRYRRKHPTSVTLIQH